MVLNSHPDATALAARFLADPADRLGRLVFADWLDEHGGESNLAWADYLRTQAEMETLRWDDPAWGELTARAAASQWQVRAQLTLIVRSVKQLVALPKLLPPYRCVLDAHFFPIDPAVTHILPESVADQDRVIPLHADLTTVYLASRTPAVYELYQKLEFILNRNIVLFDATATNMRAVLRRVYTAPTPPAVATDWPRPEYDLAADTAALDDLLTEVLDAAVSLARFEFGTACVRAAYLTRSGWREREPLTLDDFRRVVAGLLRRTGDRLPRSLAPSVEFPHQHHGRAYMIAARTDDRGLTLWSRAARTAPAVPRSDP